MLILSHNGKNQGAELDKCGGGWLATAVVCIEMKRRREVSSGDENGLSVHERDITRNKTQQIL